MRALGAGNRTAVSAELRLRLPDELVPSRWWGPRADLVDADPSDTWSAVRLVLRDGVVVGNAGWHGPPDAAGTVEAGYRVYPAARRQGVGRAVLSSMVAEARAADGVHTVRLSISPDNEPSLGLARGAGFVRTGEQVDDEDGPELVFELGVDDGGDQV